MSEFPSLADILKIFEDHPGKTFRLRELAIELGLRSSQARELKQALKQLSRERRVEYLKKNHFALVPRGHSRGAKGKVPSQGQRTSFQAPGSDTSPRNVVRGRLIGHRDGYGFVVPERRFAETDLDIYIPRDGMSSAMHGDRVEVHALRSKPDGRREGRIVRVLDRAQKTVVGEFHCAPRFNYVQPFEHRLPFEIVIPQGQEWPAEVEKDRNRQFGGEWERPRLRALEGQFAARRSAQEIDQMVVDVELVSFADPRSGSLPRGRVVEILGRRDEFGVDVEMIIRKFHLPHRFPSDALLEAESTPQYISEPERHGRRDFRTLPIVTIDGETAKDFDDAVYVERLGGGNYLLQVHIADVAHYVRPGMALDREARLRGTSVYFPDRAVPMLPLELSNGTCSLNPRVDRLAMSALMEIDGEGRIVEYEIVPGIIRSTERMTYTAVRDILAGEPSACARYFSLVDRFKLMEELAWILNRRRDRRGSIDFDLPEPLIEFDAQGRMIGITRSERNVAHRIIEEFMLAANETVADYLERRGAPSLHRVHEKPDPKKVLEFEEIAATFGYSLGIALPTGGRGGRTRVRGRDERERHPRFHERADALELDVTPQHYQRLTARIEGKPEERILSYLMLRSLKQARYSEENLGHFALATGTYTHFTSPIRRYPDLVVHRILKATLELEREEGGSRIRTTPAKTGPRHGAKSSASRVKPRLREPGDLSGQMLPEGAHRGCLVSRQELQALGIETSEAERRAADAERELIEWKKASFMAGRIGDEFEALIISLTKHGFFVELVDLFVEGFVPLDSFDDDRYIYRERLRAIVGQHSTKAYQLGGRIKVRLDRIDRDGNKLQFSVLETSRRGKANR